MHSKTRQIPFGFILVTAITLIIFNEDPQWRGDRDEIVGIEIHLIKEMFPGLSALDAHRTHINWISHKMISILIYICIYTV